VSKVTRARVGGACPAGLQVTTGDRSKRADGRQRARLGSTNRVDAVAVTDPFSVGSGVPLTEESMKAMVKDIERLGRERMAAASATKAGGWATASRERHTLGNAGL